MLTNKRLLIPLILCWIQSLLMGQEPIFHFTQYTMDDGLAHNHCYSIVKDTFGFIWIGTENGLSRFDGHSFKNYRHEPADSTTLGGNWVRRLTLDPDGNMWAACMRGGINAYDAEKDVFRRYKNPSNDSFGLAINELSGLYSDSSGEIWFGTFREGFGRFFISGHRFELYPLGKDYKNPREAWQKNTVFAMLEDIADPSVMWICNQSDIYRFDKNTRELKRISTLDQAQKHRSSIHDLYMDTPGEIWVAFWGAGLARYSIRDDRWEHFIHDREKFDEGDGYSNVCLDIERKSEDEFWVACGLDGLGVFNRKSKTFQFHSLPTELEPGKKSGFAFDILVDEKDGVWICDQINGLYQIDPSRQIFRHVSTKTQKQGSREGLNQALDFDYSPRERHYFVATGQGDGLYVYDEKMNLLHTAPSSLPSRYSYQQFVDVHVDKKGRVWVIDWLQNQLLLYDKETHLCKPLALETFDAYPKHSFTLSHIAEDLQGNLWLSSFYAGLFKYNPVDRTLNRYTGFDPTREITDKAQITCMLIAKDGKIWLGTVNYGLYIFDPSSGTFSAYPYLGSSTLGLAEDRIEAIGQDDDGYIWVGFYTKGIQRIDPNRDSAQPRKMLGFQEGLLNENIVAIDKDPQGNMWVQTQGGVFRYSMEKRHFTLYKNTEGLLGYLKPYGFTALSTGEICIGESEGFYLFRPGNEYKNRHIPVPRITSLLLGANEWRTGGRIDFGDTLQLRYFQNFFTFQFSALNFQIPAKNQYTYKLEGLDKDWVYSGFRHNASYTRVREGTYRFYLRAANNDGLWSESSLPLVVIITPPWYRSLLAYILYALMVLGAGVVVYQYQRKRWKLKTELRVQEEEAKRLKELDHAKSRIFANITHEFRTPLTVIMGMTEQLKEQKDDQWEERLHVIKRNSQALLQLINQMLELSKLESGFLTPHFIQDDITRYLGYLTESFLSYANDKGIHLNFYAETVPILMDYDPNIIDRILTNLISNALKFTPKFGKVLVIARLNESKETEMLELEVRDNGTGIEAADLDKIFNRFYQSDESSSAQKGGTGIGLALVNELIRVLNGQIHVESERGKGSTFMVSLPISRVAEPQTMHIVSPEEVRASTLETPGLAETPDMKTSEKPVLLVVEDNSDVVYYLKSLLMVNYRVFHAANGLIGLEMASKLVPDLIVSDVMMPGMDGFELCEKLKSQELTSHIPIILLTAKASPEDRLTGLRTGADAYVKKPFSKDELLVSISNLIETRIRIRRHYAEFHEHKTPYDESTAPETAFIQKLNQIISEHMDQENFDIVRLSRLLGMSRSQLHRKVKAVLDTTPALYIRRLRLDKARELLKNSPKSISEIAFETGFSSPSYFTYSFTETYGLSPSEYRNN